MTRGLKKTLLFVTATGLFCCCNKTELPVTTYAEHNMRASVERDCNCNTGIISDFCYLIGHECSDLNCNDTGIGCGWLLLQSCNGRCD